MFRFCYLSLGQQDVPPHHHRLNLVGIVLVGAVEHFQRLFLVVGLAVGKGQFLADVGQVGRVDGSHRLCLTKLFDGLLVAPHVDEARALVHQAELVVGHTFGIALIVFQRLFVVEQAVEAVGLGKESIGVVGVYGDGIFAAFDGGAVVLVHELSRRQRVPVVLREWVGVNQFAP